MADVGSDIELVRLIRKGDERAARELWARVGPSLLGVARSVLRDEARAEDVVQQGMCMLLSLSQRQAREIRDPRAYLACAVRRLALNERRAATRQATRLASQSPASGLGVAEARHDDPEAGAQSRLHEALEELPDELAEVVLLKHVGGLTFDQLELCLQQNRSTIAGRYRRAIEALRAALASAAHTPSDSPDPTIMRVTR